MNNLTNKTVKEPLVELPIVAFFLAIAAGAMDGYCYFTTKTFATFQSGNIILSGYTIAINDLSKLIPTLYSIGFFALGAMFLAFVRDTLLSKNKIYSFFALTFEIILLLILSTNSLHELFTPMYIAFILSFIAGFQGNAFHFINKMLYGNIAVTLNVQLAASYLGEALMKINRSERSLLFKKSFDYFIILIGFAFGAFISAIAAKDFGSYTLIIPVLSLLGIYIVGKMVMKKNPKTDIDAN